MQDVYLTFMIGVQLQPNISKKIHFLISEK